MDFDELEKNIQAILAKKIIFNYSKRTFTLLMVPDYGFNKNLLDKKFQLSFKDCIYFEADNTSLMAKGEEVEFIAWGKKPNDCCRNNECKIFQELFKRQLNHEMMRIKETDTYTHYFFENALGDRIELLSPDSEVQLLN